MPFPGLCGKILQNSDGQKINDIVTMIPLAFGQSYCKPLSRFNMHGWKFSIEKEKRDIQSILEEVLSIQKRLTFILLFMYSGTGKGATCQWDTFIPVKSKKTFCGPGNINV